MQTFRHNAQQFEFEYPDNWKTDVSGNVISVFNPHTGVGALQFSCFKPKVGDARELEAVLSDFLVDSHGGSTIEKRNRYFYCSVCSEDGLLWQYWMFSTGDGAVFASYNCNRSDVGKEREEVDKIIESALGSSLEL